MTSRRIDLSTTVSQPTRYVRGVRKDFLFFYIGRIVEYLFCFGRFVYCRLLLSALFRIFPVVFIFVLLLFVCLFLFLLFFVLFCLVWQLVACHTVPSENSYFPLELNDQVAFPDPGRKAGRATVALAEWAQPSMALPCDVVVKYIQNFKRNAFLPSAVGTRYFTPWSRGKN